LIKLLSKFGENQILSDLLTKFIAKIYHQNLMIHYFPRKK